MKTWHRRFGYLLLFVGLLARASAQMPAGAGANRLLVIAPRNFQAALRGFLDYKQRIRPTAFCALEEALQRGKGSDDPEKLKRFVYDEWKQHGLGYVLLVGDVDVVPVRFMVLDRVTPAAFDYAFYPSDLYYADLAHADGSFDDWNGCKIDFHARYFGEVRGEKNKSDPINYDGIDYLPEVAVGRWPVSTPEEVRVVAEKTVAYEKRLVTGSNLPLSRAAFVAVGGWVDSRGLLDRLAATLTNSWQVDKRYFSDARRQSDTPVPNHDQICGLFNAGVDLVIHTGHGTGGTWEQCFAIKDLDRLTNAARLPVVMSAGCSTAYFAPLPPYEAYMDIMDQPHKGSDHQEVFVAPPPSPDPYQRGDFNPTGLGEQILKRSANGAVAYIGCNTGSQPCALTLVEGFVEAISNTAQPTLGDCWRSAIRHYYDKERLASLKPTADWYPPSIFFQGMKFMVFGDPSLPLASRRG